MKMGAPATIGCVKLLCGAEGYTLRLYVPVFPRVIALYLRQIRSETI